MRPEVVSSFSRKFAISLFLIFLVTSSAWAVREKILSNFIPYPHGQNPESNLISDASGNLYGTTYYGGRFGSGTVFELSPGANGSWEERVIYNFTGGADGGFPEAGLVFDGVGNLYGTTAGGGGISGISCGYYGRIACGVIFELSPGNGTWTETVLHSFTGAPNDGASPATGVVFDTAGNLYGTSAGGTGNYGAVYELGPSSNGTWTEAILYNFTGLTDGGGVSSGLILDSKGNLYGATDLGGDPNCENDYGNDEGCGVIFELACSASRS